jgi:hypothetical protein
MAFNLQEFKSRGLQHHGARPTLFKIEINNPPAGVGSSEKLSLLCRATQIPAPIVEAIPVGYMGREIKVSGDRTVPDWNINVINDEDFGLRDMFEQWNMIQNSMVGNLRRDRNYKADGVITQYGKEGNVLKRYQMVGAFPTVVGNIELGWDMKNQIETFDVTLSIDWWQPIKAGGNADGGSGLLGGLLGI